MAQRRMFSLQVIDTDQFLDMPASAQALYFHLGMRADDDGFVSSPRKIMKITNSSDDDYKLLLAKQFVIPFESGICVIRHWRIHNYIQADRYHETIYLSEKQQVKVENNHYEALDTGCIHDVSRVDTQVRLGKDRIGEKTSVTQKRDDRATVVTKTVVDFLNERAGTAYRCGAGTTEKVRRLLKKGYTEEDLKKVIAVKCFQWRDDVKMKQYLRPTTLFGPEKFDDYLGEYDTEVLHAEDDAR